MSDFKKDLIKILLDKALLGVIAMAFGFYLSRLLEDYRAKRNYETFVSQQKVNACREAVGLIAQHYRNLLGLYDVIDKVAASSGPIPETDAEPGYKYIREYQEMEHRLHALAPFLPPRVFKAMGEYFDETSRLSDIVKGKIDRGKPSKDDLLTALCNFNAACAVTISNGSFGLSDDTTAG